MRIVKEETGTICRPLPSQITSSTTKQKVQGKGQESRSQTAQICAHIHHVPCTLTPSILKPNSSGLLYLYGIHCVLAPICTASRCFVNLSDPYRSPLISFSF